MRSNCKNFANNLEKGAGFRKKSSKTGLFERHAERCCRKNINNSSKTFETSCHYDKIQHRKMVLINSNIVNIQSQKTKYTEE